jgi:hypothetical protein
MKKLLLLFLTFFAFTLAKAQAPYMAGPIGDKDTIPVKFYYYCINVAGAVAYRIECDTTANFNSPLKHSLLNSDNAIASYNQGDNVFYLDSNYHFNTQYYWRIKTLFANDSSIWSKVEKFKTRAFPDIISPTDLSLANPSVFSIAHIFGASHYQLQLDTDPIFTNPIYIYNTVANYSSKYDKEAISIPGPIYSSNTQYSFRVKAYNAVDSSEWTKVYTFTTFESSNNVVELNGENALYPNPTSDILNINNSTQVTLTLSDIQGKVLETIEANPNYIFDVSTYPAGLYFLQSIDENRNIKVDKVSIVK